MSDAIDAARWRALVQRATVVHHGDRALFSIPEQSTSDTLETAVDRLRAQNAPEAAK